MPSTSVYLLSCACPWLCLHLGKKMDPQEHRTTKVQHLQWLLLLEGNCLILHSPRKVRHTVNAIEGQVRSMLFGITWIRGTGDCMAQSQDLIHVVLPYLQKRYSQSCKRIWGSVSYTEICSLLCTTQDQEYEEPQLGLTQAVQMRRAEYVTGSASHPHIPTTGLLPCSSIAPYQAGFLLRVSLPDAVETFSKSCRKSEPRRLCRVNTYNETTMKCPLHAGFQELTGPLPPVPEEFAGKSKCNVQKGIFAPQTVQNIKPSSEFISVLLLDIFVSGWTQWKGHFEPKSLPSRNHGKCWNANQIVQLSAQSQACDTLKMFRS